MLIARKASAADAGHGRALASRSSGGRTLVSLSAAVQAAIEARDAGDGSKGCQSRAGNRCAS